LFTGHRPGYRHKVLTQLQKAEIYSWNRGTASECGIGLPGYAYLGQFINHDLSLDSTDWKARETSNQRNAE